MEVWLGFNEKCHFVAMEDVEAERILLGVLEEPDLEVGLEVEVLEGPGLEVGLGALEG